MDSCLSSPLLPPLLRSSTKLRGLVRSFPPTGAQLPYHVTAAATNQSRSQPATMMDSAARMQHVSGATGITAAGAPTSLSLRATADNTEQRFAHFFLLFFSSFSQPAYYSPSISDALFSNSISFARFTIPFSIEHSAQNGSIKPDRNVRNE